jgi:hypothetical protein
MRAPQSGLTFFLDRGLGSKVVPRLLHDAGWHVTTMDERYGFVRSQTITDVEWITDASQHGDVILCKDLAIARNPLEAEAVYRTSARIFGLANAAQTGAQAGNMFVMHQEAIMTMAARAEGPYVVAVGNEGLHRKRLNLPTN